MKLEIQKGTFVVCRLGSSERVPSWAMQGPFFSVTRTAEELSVVCEDGSLPKNLSESIRIEKQWSCLKVQGPLDFALTGVMASLAAPLAASGISLFAVSTFDTDYLLVKTVDLMNAVTALQNAGHQLA